MRAVVAYESMFGNTRAVAEQIAVALERGADTRVGPVTALHAEDVADVDLLVLGAPTHTFGLSRPQTREAARQAAAKPGSGLVLQPDATGIGVREWLATLPSRPGLVAVFDTRVRMPRVVGHASRPLARWLSRSGYVLLDRPRSFFVTKNVLLPGELERAARWGEDLLARTESFTSERSR